MQLPMQLLCHPVFWDMHPNRLLAWSLPPSALYALCNYHKWTPAPSLSTYQQRKLALSEYACSAVRGATALCMQLYINTLLAQVQIRSCKTHMYSVSPVLENTRHTS